MVWPRILNNFRLFSEHEKGLVNFSPFSIFAICDLGKIMSIHTPINIAKIEIAINFQYSSSYEMGLFHRPCRPRH